MNVKKTQRRMGIRRKQGTVKNKKGIRMVYQKRLKYYYDIEFKLKMSENRFTRRPFSNGKDCFD